MTAETHGKRRPGSCRPTSASTAWNGAGRGEGVCPRPGPAAGEDCAEHGHAQGGLERGVPGQAGPGWGSPGELAS